MIQGHDEVHYVFAFGHLLDLCAATNRGHKGPGVDTAYIDGDQDLIR